MCQAARTSPRFPPHLVSSARSPSPMRVSNHPGTVLSRRRSKILLLPFVRCCSQQGFGRDQSPVRQMPAQICAHRHGWFSCQLCTARRRRHSRRDPTPPPRRQKSSFVSQTMGGLRLRQASVMPGTALTDKFIRPKSASGAETFIKKRIDVRFPVSTQPTRSWRGFASTHNRSGPGGAT